MAPRGGGCPNTMRGFGIRSFPDPDDEAPPLVVPACVRSGGGADMAATAAATNLSLSVSSFGSTLG
jgi:hypothetical protein